VIWKLALLFTIVPTVELALLIWIGTQIGVLWTTLIVIATGFTGAWLAKREGLGVLRKLRADLQGGLPPTGRIVEGVLVLCGAILLVTPGVLTDLTGFALILPFTRRLIAPIVARQAVRWFTGDPELAKQIKLDFGDRPPEAGAESPRPGAPNKQAGPAPAPPGDSHFDHPVR
tara:strand:- start:86 stop:604 length:519 start_codon:yes stop_codon:yes gene_type:complete